MLQNKAKKVKKEEVIESEDDNEDDEEEEGEAELNREDLLNLIRETEDERLEAEKELVEDGEEVENIFDEDETVTEAEDTWKDFLNTKLSAVDYEEIDKKSNYEKQNVRFPFYQNSILYQPKRIATENAHLYENIEDLHIKKRILRNMKKFDDRERELFCAMHQYRDVLCTNTTKKSLSSYILHVLNHVTKSDTLNRNNTAKMSQMTPEEKLNVDIRDKQLIRAKAVIILPFKSNAKAAVDEIIRSMTPPSGKLEVGYRKRFEKEFGSDPEIEKMKKERNRPADFKRTFAGNNEEMFRIGISFAPKAIRLYAPFYSSDIIIASPLGLRRIIGTEEDSKREYDFLRKHSYNFNRYFTPSSLSLKLMVYEINKKLYRSSCHRKCRLYSNAELDASDPRDETFQFAAKRSS